MSGIKKGDKVKVVLIGKFSDGTVFDSTEEIGPIEFEVGAGQVMPKFEEHIIGMKKGEKKTFTVSSDDAYGPERTELVGEVSREHLPKDIDPEVGMQLQIQQPQGPAATVKIVAVKEDAVTLDANHPLAGKDLTYEVEIIEVG